MALTAAVDRAVALHRCSQAQSFRDDDVNVLFIAVDDDAVALLGRGVEVPSKRTRCNCVGVRLTSRVDVDKLNADIRFANELNQNSCAC